MMIVNEIRGVLKDQICMQITRFKSSQMMKFILLAQWNQVLVVIPSGLNSKGLFIRDQLI